EILRGRRVYPRKRQPAGHRPRHPRRARAQGAGEGGERKDDAAWTAIAGGTPLGDPLAFRVHGEGRLDARDGGGGLADLARRRAHRGALLLRSGHYEEPAGGFGGGIEEGRQ